YCSDALVKQHGQRLIHNMESESQTGVGEVLLLGLSEDPELQPLLFGLFLTMYLVTVLGNLFISLAVSSDSHLHTPMYFSLSHLPFTDISFSTTTVLKMLVNLQTQSKSITYARFTDNMEPRNQTDVSEFLLLGLTDDLELQPFLFCLFLAMYLITVLGNLLIILAITCDSHLHTPMYLFLSNLSFTDICISTTAIPKMLVNVQAEIQHITYIGCLTQIGFVLVFVGLENFLLAAMAYDRYVAICHPLRYTVLIIPRFCVLLILLSLFISTVLGLLLSLMALRLSFCKDLEIPHFFCELAQVIKLACSDTLMNNILIYTVASLFCGVPLSGIIFSYTQIVPFVLRMPSAGTKLKAFSTCGSHLAVVSLFYGTLFGVYISSVVTDSPRKTAMMNPFIYSLRNKDMKRALRKLISRIPSFP
ncbi:hypothetical protein E2I00_007024, partial [Balaenoptera physalus]